MMVPSLELTFLLQVSPLDLLLSLSCYIFQSSPRICFCLLFGSKTTALSLLSSKVTCRGWLSRPNGLKEEKVMMLLSVARPLYSFSVRLNNGGNCQRWPATVRTTVSWHGECLPPQPVSLPATTECQSHSLYISIPQSFLTPEQYSL